MSTTENLSTVQVKSDHLDALDDACEPLFGTDAVSRRAIIERLLVDHEAVPYDG
jgi:hypothetical protein